jgi:hypothetical protein
MTIAVEPAPIRRLVAGPDKNGTARVLSDGPSPRRIVNEGNGMVMTDLWSTDAVPPVIERGQGADPVFAGHAYFPLPGGTHFMINRIASARDRREAEARADVAAANAAFGAHVPGMFDTFEHGGDGMHTSQTIDYGLILEGIIDLELGDGSITRLAAGDTYVLQAPRHKWQPLEDAGCVIAVILVGAESI